jgi:succinate dehydrogenase / fumarate reductase membrane anchor subunit
MRLSGVVLLLLAVGHLLWMHFVIGVDNINFQTVVERWTGPLGPFWRTYDLVLLAFALTHGANGARTVLDDYVLRPGMNWLAKSLLYLATAIFMLMGAWIIFAFRFP